MIVVEYPAAVCTCHERARQWNGYGTCLRCGGSYKAEGDLAPIVIPGKTEERS